MTVEKNTKPSDAVTNQSHEGQVATTAFHLEAYQLPQAAQQNAAKPVHIDAPTYFAPLASVRI
jgi:hypothetical protein